MNNILLYYFIIPIFILCTDLLTVYSKQDLQIVSQFKENVKFRVVFVFLFEFLNIIGWFL